MNTHLGNIENQILREEHDGDNNAKRVTIVAGGLSGGQATITPVGLVTLAPSPNFIGLVTVVQSSAARTITGNVTLSDSKGFIGLVTVVQASAARTITGNVTLSDSKTFIGLVTVVQASSARTLTGNVTLSDAKTYVGLTTTTLGSGTQQIGSVTLSHPVALAGNLTLSDSKGFIGLVTAVGSFAIGGNVTLNPSPNFIGIVTVANPGSMVGNVTLDAGSKTGIVGNLTLSDPKGFIGLVTAVGTFSTTFAGNVTLDAGSRTGIVGNVTVAPAAATASGTIDGEGETVTIDCTGYNTVTTYFSGAGLNANETFPEASVDGTNWVAVWVKQIFPVGSTNYTAYTQLDATTTQPTYTFMCDVSGFKRFRWRTTNYVSGGINMDLYATQAPPISAAIYGENYATGSTAQPGMLIGGKDENGIFRTLKLDGTSKALYALVSVYGGSIRVAGNVTLSDAKTFIGLVTVVQSSAARTITGNVTLSDSKTYIGLVTAMNAYGSAATVFTGIISATGNTTVATPPASNRFFIKNIHISSLGRSEVEIRSGATTLIPFTSLSTTGGYAEHFGELGLPARAQDAALVIGLNGAATISYMINVRYEA